MVKLNQGLEDIAEKIRKGERLDFEDGVRLFNSTDLLGIGLLAQEVKRRRHGRKVFFAVNCHVNHTNVCVGSCRFCAFRRRPGDAEAYTLKPEEVIKRVRAVALWGLREIHLVGGLNPDLSLDYFRKILRGIKERVRGVTIKGLTAVEIDFLARQEGLTVREVLQELKAAGLDALPGGGAEIFAPAVRQRLCPAKISGERWLEIHAEAHALGIPTNATMLYGHLESYEDRVDHLLRLRELQDRTGGFQAFIPLPFLPQNNPLAAEEGVKGTTGFDDLKTIAISRLLLDNFPHIKVYWVMVGTKLSQVALNFGADDIEGTVLEERIAHSAGAESPQVLTRRELEDLIMAAGGVPVERDALYRVVREGV
ncbi:aminofutalosine synthase MqnE [Ammonifex thiophilus]|uniref:Aminodeoxyfutalosine synthase n=1 Tax=Ammonifex thiophilus TaxID=444093 RepID=A0A3D8P527_9THEO|nr:aminofutalosine synthase MqnE [Ammonifex thiophilus]